MGKTEGKSGSKNNFDKQLDSSPASSLEPALVGTPTPESTSLNTLPIPPVSVLDARIAIADAAQKVSEAAAKAATEYDLQEKDRPYADKLALEKAEAKKKKEQSEAENLKNKKIAGWFAGSAKGEITLKEWMDFLKNSTIYGLIFSYVIYPGPKNRPADLGWTVYASMLGIVIIGFFLVAQGISLAVLTWPKDGASWKEKFVRVLVTFGFLMGVAFGSFVYVAYTAKFL